MPNRKKTPRRHPPRRLTPTAADRVLAGTVRRPHGVQGAFIVDLFSGDSSRFAPGDSLLIAGKRSRIVAVQQGPGKSAILRIDSVDSPEAADALRGATVEVKEEDLPPLEPGEYYHFQLIDARVYTMDGEYLGILREILETGANDVYLVRSDDPGSPEILVPAVREVVQAVDVDGGVIVVDLPDGLR